MSDEVFIRLIEGIGNPILLTFILSLSLIIVAFKSKFSDYLSSQFKLCFDKPKKRKIKSLIHHDVFNALDRVIYEVKVQRFYSGKEYDYVKTRMCYDFAENKTIVCGEFMERFLTRSDIDAMGSDSLKNLIIDLQSDMHKEYIRRTTELWRKKGIKGVDVAHVIHLFEKFRYNVVSSFSHRIEAIFASTFHATNYEKTLAVFDMWAMGIDLLPKDMQTTFESLNGKFKDIKY